ncbi:MAG: hypothetical protein M3Q22_10920, partial [Actinomycetota bacterium]|nr:hypothetical protein [Actinomycetota bacterium]
MHRGVGEDGPPELVARHELADPAVRRVLPVLEADPELHPCSGAGGDHHETVAGVVRHRLLTQHLLSGLRGRHDVLTVEAVRAGDVDDVDPGVGEHLFERRVGGRRAVVPGEGARRLRPAAQHAVQLCTVGPADGVGHVAAGPVPMNAQPRVTGAGSSAEEGRRRHPTESAPGDEKDPVRRRRHQASASSIGSKWSMSSRVPRQSATSFQTALTGMPIV